MLTVSERRACRVLGQVRRTQRYTSILSDEETALVTNVVSLATEYGRYGYRRITALLRADGWHVNHKRVERIWRQEGLKVPARQPKRGRLWFNDGSCIRLRPEYRNHVWAYDFVFDRTGDGRQLKFLTVVDEYSRQCLAIDVDRKQTSREVLRTLAKVRSCPLGIGYSSHTAITFPLNPWATCGPSCPLANVQVRVVPGQLSKQRSPPNIPAGFMWE